MSGATIHDSRLTDADRMTIATKMADAVAGWNAHNGEFWKPSDSDLGPLERIGHHAIGCSSHDLRDSELSEILAMAVVALERIR